MVVLPAEIGRDPTSDGDTALTGPHSAPDRLLVRVRMNGRRENPGHTLGGKRRTRVFDPVRCYSRAALRGRASSAVTSAYTPDVNRLRTPPTRCPRPSPVPRYPPRSWSASWSEQSSAVMTTAAAETPTLRLAALPPGPVPAPVPAASARLRPRRLLRWSVAS